MLSKGRSGSSSPSGDLRFSLLARRRWILLKLVLILAGIWLAGRTVLVLLPWPALDEFLGRPYSTRCYDRHGQLLQVLPLEEGLRREWYDLEALPPRLVEVFLAAEDKRFYQHHGVDVRAIIRAALLNMQEGRRVSGASTITMQLARLVVPRTAGKKVTFWTKIQEAAIAIRLELKLSKDEILEQYLNNLPFGLQAEGVGSAARTYFGSSPNELDDAEIHLLSIIPRRPATYNPSVPENAYNAALEIGKITGFTTTMEQWQKDLLQEETYVYPQRLPHFILYVQNLYKNQADSSFTQAKMPAELHLSVDAKLTEEMEILVQTLLEKYRQARLSHGAIFAMDNITGEIICWSGGDFWSEKAGQVDGVLVKNQSGSTMKPFLYAMALEMGFSPATVMADIPMDFGKEEVYAPLNFNNQFNGPVLFRTALASSLNIPAVYLLSRLGVDNYLSVLEQLGIQSLKGLREQQGFSLALGSGELSLQELVRAFSVFPRGGYAATNTHLLCGAAEGLRQAEKEKAVFQPDTTAIICDILSDQRARALGFGYTQVFNTPYPAIFKTGTSNQFQDIVALGATHQYTVGVWMGNYSGETVLRQTGSSLPAQVVRHLLDKLSANAPVQDFPQPKNYKKVSVCALSGMGVTEHCPTVTEEYVELVFADASQGLEACDWHYSGETVFEQAHSNSFQTTSIRYPQEYQRWLQGKTTPSSYFAQASLKILYPQSGAIFLYDQGIPASAQKIRVDATGSGERAALFVNGQFLGDSIAPFSWFVPLEQGKMSLEVVLDSGERVCHEIFVQ